MIVTHVLPPGFSIHALTDLDVFRFDLHGDVIVDHFDFFFFNDTATTEIYTLSLHDALPISHIGVVIDVVKFQILHESVAEKTHNQVCRVLTFSTGSRLVKIAIFFH